MNPASQEIDYEFEFEEMLRFPWDTTKPREFSLEGPPSKWPYLINRSARNAECWRRHDEDELAKNFLLYSKSPDFNAKTLYFQLLREWLLNSDDNHEECRVRQAGHEFWPMRAIFIGDEHTLSLV
ncbi:hypothetical protein CEP53_000435 [Fusarium sp. AF-6]|nr:hypothetical protein CEP53_000435 [Fusarium sp. AF-6]